jgi:hypothetical protein
MDKIHSRRMTEKQKYGKLASGLLNLLLLLLTLRKLQLKKKEAQGDFGVINGWRGDILDVDYQV